MTDKEREARDWPEGWMNETSAAVRVAEEVTPDMVDTAWAAFQGSAGTSLTKMRAALEAAALLSRRAGEVHALRSLAADLESSGLGDEVAEVGMVEIVRERAARLEGGN